MAGNFVFVKDNPIGVSLELRAIGHGTKHALKDLLEEAAGMAAQTMRLQAPRKTGRMRSSIEVSGIEYIPTGSGGRYEIVAGIKDSLKYPEWVFYGTGIHSTKPGSLRNRITSSNGKVMQFYGYKSGNILYRSSVEGQKPQKEWVFDAQEVANSYIRTRLSMIKSDFNIK